MNCRTKIGFVKKKFIYLLIYNMFLSPIDISIPNFTPQYYYSNKYAESIKYEEFNHEYEQKLNKNIMEFNFITTEDFIKQQNQILLEKLFNEEIKKEYEK